MRKTWSLIVCIILLTMVVGCENNEEKVTIKRDSYGVPHVYADSVYGIFYGYGYAIAQDRLFQIEIATLCAQGRVSEFLGAEYVEFDKGIRANYKPDSIRQQLDNLPQKDKDVFKGYAAGVNAWIMKIRNNPEELMPKQYIDFGFEPNDWTAYDVAMVFVGSMVNRFADFNTEIDNQNILNSLVAKHGEAEAVKIFDQLLPISVAGSPTTIPPGEWPLTALPIKTDRKDIEKDESINKYLAGINQKFYSKIGRTFSNVAIVGKKKAQGANAILINGPQFGNFVPGYVYSIGLHGAGFDLVGNTPFGYPVLLFGYNRNITWGSTAGVGDLIDVYAEALNPDNNDQYMYKGEYLDLEKRTEVIKVKGGADVAVEVYRSIHGPIMSFDYEKNIAFARKRTWEGFETDTLIGWMNMTRASDFDEWLRQTERCAININMYYADKDGNIGYVFAGKYPKRNPGHDNRLPVSGNGDMDWEAILPFSQNPQVYNPEQGYITNWNNRPAMGIPNPDLFWFVWAKAERVQALIDRLEEKDKFNADDMWNLISQTSFLDVSIPYFKPFLEKVGEVSSDQRVKDAVQVLTQWDNVSTDKDNDGRFDQSATAIFRTFLSYMVEYTLSDDLSDVFPLFADTGYPSGEYVSGGVKTIVEALIDPESQGYDLFNGKTPEAVIESAFTAALDELTQEYGASMDDWKLPVMKFVFSPKNFQNVPQADEDETLTLPITMNRGTENNMTVFTENSVIGYEVTPPGQSGFISPAGVKNRHYDDQLRLYAEFGKKRTWIYPEDVENDSESVTVLELK